MNALRIELAGLGMDQVIYQIKKNIYNFTNETKHATVTDKESNNMLSDSKFSLTPMSFMIWSILTFTGLIYCNLFLVASNFYYFHKHAPTPFTPENMKPHVTCST